MKYRKKPVVIAAVKWTGENPEQIIEFCEGNAKLELMCESGVQMVIKTLEGQHLASHGDMIIKGVQGEFYPCKPDIFEQTYEKVGE